MLLLLQSKPSTGRPMPLLKGSIFTSTYKEVMFYAAFVFLCFILSVYLSIGVLATSHKNYTRRMFVNIFTRDISLDKECPILEVTRIQIPDLRTPDSDRIRLGGGLRSPSAVAEQLIFDHQLITQELSDSQTDSTDSSFFGFSRARQCIFGFW